MDKFQEPSVAVHIKAGDLVELRQLYAELAGLSDVALEGCATQIVVVIQSARIVLHALVHNIMLDVAHLSSTSLGRLAVPLDTGTACYMCGVTSPTDAVNVSTSADRNEDTKVSVTVSRSSSNTSSSSGMPPDWEFTSSPTKFAVRGTVLLSSRVGDILERRGCMARSIFLSLACCLILRYVAFSSLADR